MAGVFRSALKSHQVNGQKFTPDGWWGGFEKDGEDDFFQLPVENQELFQQIKSDFNLQRDLEQTGLSLVMPYVQDEVTARKLSEHVIREYFWPILNGRLVVDIVEDAEEISIDADSIDSILSNHGGASAKKFLPYIRVASLASNGGQYPVVTMDLATKPALPKWDQNYLTAEKAKEIHDSLVGDGSLICIRCPVYVQRNDSDSPTVSSFEIFLSKDVGDDARKPWFVREGITIPEDRVPTVRGYTSIVLIDSGPLAALLGDSENPAHTEWEKNATKFKGKYKWGHTTIDFVRLAVGKLLKLLSQGDEEVDVSVLSDIFYLDLPENEDEVPEPRRKRQATENDGDKPEPEPKPDPPPAKPRTYRLSKISGGFVVRGPETDFDVPRSYEIQVAYDFSGASKASVMKRYHKNDFNLANSRGVGAPVLSGVRDSSVDVNKIQFTVDNKEFEVVVQGFDERRDIVVDVKSEAIVDEAV